MTDETGSTPEAPAPPILDLKIRCVDLKDDFKLKILATDTFNELKQYLLRLPMSDMPLTCFSLQHEGTELDLVTPITEQETELHASEDGQIIIDLIPEAYTQTEARVHIRKVREALRFPSYRPVGLQTVEPGLSVFAGLEAEIDSLKPEPKEPKEPKEGENGEAAKPVDPFDEKPPETHAFAGIELGDVTSLSAIPELNRPAHELLPAVPTAVSPAARSLQLSQWNPPPPTAALGGHLLYLHVTTLEGRTFHITSTVSGFYVSNCSADRFDPSPRKASGKFQQSKSLFELLTSLSPAISTQLGAAAAEKVTAVSVLAQTEPSNAFLAYPWLVRPRSDAQVPDLSRTQSLLYRNPLDAEEVKDWNEDFQSTRELRKVDAEGNGSMPDRVMRERLLNRFAFDFTEAATKGAVDVVSGNVAPLNPEDPADSHIFLANGIFYSLGFDGAGTFTELGGHEAARVAAGKDVAGGNFVSSLDIDGLHPSISTAVDYCGRRVLAQTLVPGIFRDLPEDESLIVYGSIDNGVKVVADERFEEPFNRIAESCHIKKHIVYDNSGEQSATLVISSDVKGIVGTDGRKYVIDLYKLTPPDLLFIEEHYGTAPDSYPHRLALLRPEAVDSWWSSGFQVVLDEKRAAREDKPDLSDEELEAIRTEEQALIVEYSKTARINPDVLVDLESVPAEAREQIKKDQDEVRAVCKFLTETIIPNFVRDLKNGSIATPLAGTHLTTVLHKRGINMRYLGLLLKLAEKEGQGLEHFASVVKLEAVVRVIKHSVLALLRDVPVFAVPHAIVRFFNCLFGNISDKLVLSEELLLLYPGVASYEFFNTTSASVRAAIADDLLRRFRIKVDNDWFEALPKKALLREASRTLGLQWVAKYYPVTEPTTSIFVVKDLANIVPKVKLSVFNSVMAEEALEMGRLSAARGDVEIGLELVSEALSLFEQVYGPVHPDVSRAYSRAATIYHENKDAETACDLCRKALVIAERTLGPDSFETIFIAMNLTLYENSRGNALGALRVIRCAIETWNSVALPDHPETVNTVNNIAMILHGVHAYKDSVPWYKLALSLSSKLFSDSLDATIALYSHLSEAQVLSRDFHGAASSARKVHEGFNRQLGAEHDTTKDAKSWMDKCIQAAVTDAKVKASQPQQLRRPVKSQLKAAPVVTPVKETSLLTGKGTKGEKSINELLAYINGAPKKKSKSKAKAKAAKA